MWHKWLFSKSIYTTLELSLLVEISYLYLLSLNIRRVVSTCSSIRKVNAKNIHKSRTVGLPWRGNTSHWVLTKQLCKTKHLHLEWFTKVVISENSSVESFQRKISRYNSTTLLLGRMIFMLIPIDKRITPIHADEEDNYKSDRSELGNSKLNVRYCFFFRKIWGD